MTRIVVADDHKLFRELLRDVFSRKEETFEIIGESGDGEEISTLVAQYCPDLLLLDYKMPGLGRLSAFCQEVTHHSPVTRILIVSGYAREEVALEAALGGAHGYLLKGASIANLLTAIATLQAGGIWVDPHLPRSVFHTFVQARRNRNRKLRELTRQELHVLSLVARGMSNKRIASRLHISEKTVKNHLTHVFAKLQTNSRQQAAHYLQNAGQTNDTN